MHPDNEQVTYPVANSNAKRVFDILIAGTALILLSPLFALVALLVRVNLGKPIIFRQARPGLNEQIFDVIKFRTMRAAPHKASSLESVATDGARLTRFGRILRKLSLDELPQLWSILRGDMSLVGPRPLLVDYLPLYSKEQRKRHAARPGLTGLAQVQGRNSLDWNKRFALDVQYVENWRLGLDVKILLKTIAVVITGKNVSTENHATTAPFEGTQTDETRRR